MWLINARTLRLQYFAGAVPPYAILSHTWGREEVSLQDFLRPGIRERKLGFAKIQATCRETLRQNLEFAWVDSCCIDKTSSAELGESINSMYRWYQRAAVCLAFLEDVPRDSVSQNSWSFCDNGKTLEGLASTSFAKSRWFTRGWTLQELIAPRRLTFYDREWEVIQERRNITRELQAITGVNESVIQGLPPREIPLGRRMSWASGRQTTRQEDMAYCLFGIFSVNLPLMYGEGTRAFKRLQEEILKQSDDHTLFAWRGVALQDPRNVRGLLASSPRDFANFRHKLPRLTEGKLVTNEHKDDLVRYWDSASPQLPIYVTNKGIRMTCRVQDLRPSWATGEVLILVLDCMFDGNPMRAAGVYLKRIEEGRYARIRVGEIAEVVPQGRHISVRTIHVIPSAAETTRTHYEEPWTTVYRVRRMKTDEATMGQTVGTTVQRFSKSIVWRRKGGDYGASSMYGSYFLDAVFLSGRHGRFRFFQINPGDLKEDWVIPTARHFMAFFILASGDNKNLVLISIAATESASPEKHFSLAVRWLPAKKLNQDPAAIPRSVKAMRHQMRQGNSSSNEAGLVDDDGLGLHVELLPVTVEGLPMHELSMRGPWPVSYLRLPARVVANIVGNTLLWSGSALIIMLAYVFIPADLLELPSLEAGGDDVFPDFRSPQIRPTLTRNVEIAPSHVSGDSSTL